MATPLGVDTVSTIARRFILPETVETVYNSNPLTYRLLKANKKIVRGGTQIEQQFQTSRFTNGGAYSGMERLDIAPNDTKVSGAWDWKQYYVPVTVDGLTMIKVDSPESVADLLREAFDQAEAEMIENLATGIWSDATTNTKEIDGLGGAVDDGTIAPVYAGRTRATNPFLNAQVDSTTTTLTRSALQSFHGQVGEAGRQPSLIVSRQEQYDRYLNTGHAQQEFGSAPAGQDVQLYSAGFSNALFNGIPWVVDSHVPDGPNASNSAIFFLNEAFLKLVVANRSDFLMRDFQMPDDQDAMSSLTLWAGNLICTNPARQGKLTAINS